MDVMLWILWLRQAETVCLPPFLPLNPVEKEAVIGRLCNKLTELQEWERELEAQTQGYGY